MTEKKQKLTKDGYKELEKQLKYLKSKVRQEIAERIRQSKEFGEIGENIEYENAKSEQARVEQEIMKLEKILRNAEIIAKKEEVATNVEIGVLVKAKYVEEDQIVSLEIVGTSESDPLRRPPRISDESPIGKALVEAGTTDDGRKIGAEKGQIVEVETPIGTAHYEVLEILPAGG
jgi:transcription elongation factor GreA